MTRTGGAKTRTQLVQEAMRAFGKGGYEGTSLEAIAEAVGVRKQTLLYHFPSKEDLFQACVEEFAGRVATVLEACLEGPDEGWDRVERVIRGIFGMGRDYPELVRFAREAPRRSPEVVMRVAGHLEPLRKRALVFLEHGMEQGVFCRQDPGLLLFTLYTAVIGSLTEAGVLGAVVGGDKGRKALKERENQLIDFVRRALAP